MARIRGKDTAIEKQLRSELHRRGLRFRLHQRDLPGTPDIVFPGRRAVIFVNGCFWHQHGCRLSATPKSNREFWTAKFEATRQRDRAAVSRLADDGWRILTVWECATRGSTASPIQDIGDQVVHWLDGDSRVGMIPAAPGVES